VKRVAVTGLGAVTPLGHDTETFWEGVTNGRLGFGPITCALHERLTQKVAAPVAGFDPLAHFDEKSLAILDRVSQFAIVAAREAIAQSGLVIDGALSERTAAIVGTGSGGMGTQDDAYRRVFLENLNRVFPLTIPRLMVNAPASLVSMHCGIRGPTFVTASACASATHAIGQAFHMVRSGMVDAAVTGGTEASIVFGCMKGWEAMRIMAPDLPRPFSRDRKGMIIAEGAAMFVLEPLATAQARGATILAEIVGFGMSADAGDLTSPDEGGMTRAMLGALSDASLSPSDVDYVNAHGTGTLVNDIAETAALKRVFGDHAPKLAVSSTKSMVGHALGAAGALELLATVMALREGLVPPTMNWLGPDPACDLDVVPNEARTMPINIAISNSFAFGGLNAVLAVKRAA
jgi:nodulation protein E